MASTQLRGIAAIAAILVVLSAAAARTGPVAAQEWHPPSKVWVADSGHTVDGLFLDNWRTYPALFGMPITEELSEKVAIGDGKTSKYTVQYFENLAIAYVPEDERASWQVQALPLGTRAFEADANKLKLLNLQNTGVCNGLPDDACRFFPETKHTVRMGFEDFWTANDGERLLGSPLTEEFVDAKGVTTQYFENAVLLWTQETDVTVRPIGKESAKRLKLKTAAVAQPLDIPVYDESLFIAPVVEAEPELSVGGFDSGAGPGPQQGAWKEIVISISAQSLWAYEDGELVISSLVSTGTAEVPETETPIGYFTILVKFELETMEGTINNESYRVEDVPWVMYFDNIGNALHGAYWHNNFGTPMSHGCVNLPLDVAQFLYGWAPEGTAVSVIA